MIASTPKTFSTFFFTRNNGKFNLHLINIIEHSLQFLLSGQAIGDFIIWPLPMNDSHLEVVQAPVIALDFCCILQEFHRAGVISSSTITTYKFPVALSARYLRFTPTKQNNWNCLRVEVYGSSTSFLF